MRPLIAGLVMVIAVWVHFEARSALPVIACTPGPPFGLETAALADAIVLADAVSVGSAVNSAPTVTTSSADTTASPSPAGADIPAATATPYSFDLAGYGATLRIVDIFAGTVPETLDADAAGRAFMEREIREREAYRGPPIIFSNCPIEWAARRYETGHRYLVFLTRTDNGIAVTFRYRVDGTEIVLTPYPRSDPRWMMEALAMGEATYQRYFAGISADVENGMAFITADRVPLTSVMRAVAGLRGDPSIAPPETGSVGLAAGR